LSGVSNNHIAGNYIGTEITGTDLRGNSEGIRIANGSNNNYIGIAPDGTGKLNLISGSSGFGIIIAESNHNYIAGNYIGTDISGTISLGNSNGIKLQNGASSNIIGTNGDGIADAEEKNLISGNDFANPNTNNNVIAGNLIGTNFDGTSSLANGGSGISIESDSNRIGTNGDGNSDLHEANLISGNGTTGIHVSSNGNWISGNLIGVDKTGMIAIGNTFDGIVLDITANNNLIGTNGDGSADAEERNIISGNSFGGISIIGDNNVVAGNYIGTDATGNTGHGNLRYGVSLGNGATGNLIGTDGDGIADAAEGNLISGNGRFGVQLSGAAHNTISGNLIGTDKNGALAIPNGHTAPEFGGIRITNSSFSNVIGTDGDGIGDAVEGNLISGNSGRGVKIDGSNTQNNTVAGNYIGTDISGSSALGNGLGVEISNGASHNRIGTNADGSSDLAERNLISSNSGPGIFIGGSHNQIAGNYIGTGKFGVSALGNNTNGITVVDNTTGNDIGGSSIKANTIAFNHGFGIVLFGMNSDKVQILNNSIFSNEKSGIGLADEADTWLPFNDPGDVDMGPNDLMNFPILNTASAIPTSIIITGQIVHGLPGTNFLIQLFDNEVCDSPANFSEGKTFITSIYQTTDMSGNAYFSANINAVIPPGHFITATATTDNKTSEFSECVEVTAGHVTYSQELEEDRCNLFDQEEVSLMTFEARPETLLFNMYIKKPSGIPGLEVTIPDDTDEWIYTAFLGDTKASKCNFQGYEGRLYCDFIIPESYLNTTQILKVFLNKCISPIYLQEGVSIFLVCPTWIRTRTRLFK